MLRPFKEKKNCAATVYLNRERTYLFIVAGQVVMRGDSYSRGLGFKSQHRHGLFFTLICKKLFFVSKEQEYIIVFLNGPFPASFSLFSAFQYTVDSKQMFNI